VVEAGRFRRCRRRGWGSRGNIQGSTKSGF
jgi:hypothetical protein